MSAALVSLPGGSSADPTYPRHPIHALLLWTTRHGLSRVEKEILRAAALGSLACEDLAAARGVTRNTVKSQVHRLLQRCRQPSLGALVIAVLREALTLDHDGARLAVARDDIADEVTALRIEAADLRQRRAAACLATAERAELEALREVVVALRAQMKAKAATTRFRAVERAATPLPLDTDERAELELLRAERKRVGQALRSAGDELRRPRRKGLGGDVAGSVPEAGMGPGVRLVENMDVVHNGRVRERREP